MEELRSCLDHQGNPARLLHRVVILPEHLMATRTDNFPRGHSDAVVLVSSPEAAFSSLPAQGHGREQEALERPAR